MSSLIRCAIVMDATVTFLHRRRPSTAMAAVDLAGSKPRASLDGRETTGNEDAAGPSMHHGRCTAPWLVHRPRFGRDFEEGDAPWVVYGQANSLLCGACVGP